MRGTITNWWSERRDIDDKISLATVRHPGGGRRWCFVCPAQGWRVRKLYLPARARHFLSRQAYRLAYETEHLDDVERAWRRVRKCRRQLGSDPDGIGYPPPYLLITPSGPGGTPVSLTHLCADAGILYRRTSGGLNAPFFHSRNPPSNALVLAPRRTLRGSLSILSAFPPPSMT